MKMLPLSSLWQKLRLPGYIALTIYLWVCGIALDKTRLMTVIDTCLATLCTLVTIELIYEKLKKGE